jgi:protein-tyrosine phosphatase
MSAPVRRVLLVCTGNICRSAMGAVFLREHLRAAGAAHVEVVSAGTHAEAGRPALPEAIAAVAAIRGDLSSHRATPLDLIAAREADLVLCAAREHRVHILSWWPDVPPDHVRLFNEPIAKSAPPDVDDPYGWDEGVFKLAARVIDRAMHAWAQDLAARWPA